MWAADHTAALGARFDDVAALAARTNKATVLVVQQFPVTDDAGVCFPPVRESIANILAFVELGDASDLVPVLAAAERFNWIAVDCDRKLPASAAIVETARSAIASSRLLFYSDNQVWFDSALDMVQRLEHGLSGRRVLLCGEGPLAEAFRFVLPRIGASIAPSEGTAASGNVADASIVLGASQKRASVDVAVVERLPASSSVYDLGIGNLTAAAAELARSRGFRLYRLDNRAGISSAIVRLLETDNMVKRLMGQVRLRDVDVVAGGLLAPPGAIIVDDIRRPTMIFGIADGQGRFKREPLDAADVERLDYVRGIIAHALEASPSRV